MEGYENSPGYKEALARGEAQNEDFLEEVVLIQKMGIKLIDFLDSCDKNPMPEQVEEFMRPFGIFSCFSQKVLLNFFAGSEYSLPLILHIICWMEANNIASINLKNCDSDSLVQVSKFLREPCDCITKHLPKALEHTSKKVSVRVLRIVEEFKREEGDFS